MHQGIEGLRNVTAEQKAIDICWVAPPGRRHPPAAARGHAIFAAVPQRRHGWKLRDGARHPPYPTARPTSISSGTRSPASFAANRSTAILGGGLRADPTTASSNCIPSANAPVRFRRLAPARASPRRPARRSEWKAGGRRRPQGSADDATRARPATRLCKGRRRVAMSGSQRQVTGWQTCSTRFDPAEPPAHWCIRIIMERWVIYAIASMAFAGFTSVIAKKGLNGISSELGLWFAPASSSASFRFSPRSPSASAR